MGARTACTAVVVALVTTGLAGCNVGGNKKATPAAGSPSGGQNGSASAGTTPAKSYTAAQLKRALIHPPAGATDTRTGSGSFTKVLAKIAAGAPGEDTPDDSSCDALSRADLKRLRTVPSAFVTFTQGERFSSVLLVAAPGSQAKQAATEPVPQACRTTKTHMGGMTITAKVVSDEPFDLGDGGRISQTDETSDGMRLRSWQVDFAGPGYLAMSDVGGVNVTKADAERLARQAYGEASATLK